MAEEIAFENVRISINFEGLVTLTLDRAILHTVVHYSSTSTYKPNFIEIKETFCGRTDVRTHGHLRPALSQSRPNKSSAVTQKWHHAKSALTNFGP